MWRATFPDDRMSVAVASDRVANHVAGRVQSFRLRRTATGQWRKISDGVVPNGWRRWGTLNWWLSGRNCASTAADEDEKRKQDKIRREDEGGVHVHFQSGHKNYLSDGTMRNGPVVPECCSHDDLRVFQNPHRNPSANLLRTRLAVAVVSPFGKHQVLEHGRKTHS